MKYTNTRRLIFYTGQIEPLDLFTEELKKGFEKLGYETFTFDLKNQAESIVKLDEFCKSPVDAVITFNTMFYNLKLANGNNAWDELGITYITILVDHPDNFRETIKKFSANTIVLCIDRKHMEFVGRFFPNVATYGFLPHGGTESNLVCNDMPFEKRKMDVMYAGGIQYADIESIQISNYLQDRYKELFDVKKFCLDVYECLVKDTHKTVESGIECVLHDMNLFIDADVPEILISDFMFIHVYILSFYRSKVLETIANAGIELYIFGGGWNDFKWAKLPNVHLMGEISPKQVLEEMANSKIVLSMMAWFKDGAHERVFNGLLAKALVVSENSIYMNEVFNGNDGDAEQDIVLYDLNKLDTLSERIIYMLKHEDEAKKIIVRGYEKVKQFHTWEMRAMELDKDLL